MMTDGIVWMSVAASAKARVPHSSRSEGWGTESLAARLARFFKSVQLNGPSPQAATNRKAHR